jgi:hypothetical protein
MYYLVRGLLLINTLPQRTLPHLPGTGMILVFKQSKQEKRDRSHHITSVAEASLAPSLRYLVPKAGDRLDAYPSIISEIPRLG